MKKKISAIGFLFMLTAAALFTECSHQRPVIKHKNINDNYYIIWSHSDIQPADENNVSNYPDAVNDVIGIFEKIDVAICVGDIVQKRELRETFEWYLNVREKAPVDEWFDIAGNHEWRDIELYKELIESRLNYSVKRGNLLILLMSNEKEGRKTYISDETFYWWKEKVKNNQDRIIITVTHGALAGSGLLPGRIKRLKIIDSERFLNVLKEYNMDLWISGHSHFPGWLPGTALTNSKLNISFIDNGAIRKDFMTGVESRFIFFKEGDDFAVMKRRYHHKERFAYRDFVIPLSHPFVSIDGLTN